MEDAKRIKYLEAENAELKRQVTRLISGTTPSPTLDFEKGDKVEVLSINLRCGRINEIRGDSAFVVLNYHPDYYGGNDFFPLSGIKKLGGGEGE